MTSAKNTEDIELLMRDVVFGKKIFNFLNHTTISKQKVDHRLLLRAHKVYLLYVFFYTHGVLSNSRPLLLRNNLRKYQYSYGFVVRCCENHGIFYCSII